MTFFIKNGNTFNIAPEDSVDIRDHLPVGTYIVKYNAKGEFYYLEIAEAFGKLPGKVYGATNKTAQRILATYLSRSVSTGVLLAGEKGSGKTMLAKMLSILAAERNAPTLIINSAFYGDVFNKFIQDIDQECLILFDEFEKIYTTDENGENPQAQLLTLLDGVFPQKKLFVLTCNNINNIDDHMINRPGRIYYFLEYKGVEKEFIREYLTDNLKDKTQIEPFILAVDTLFDNFNFDMMKALVEEMNRYDETIRQVMEFINTRPSTVYSVPYDVTVTPDKGVAKVKLLYHKQVRGNPLSADHDITILLDKDERVNLDLSQQYLVHVDVPTGTFEYKVKGYTVTVKRAETQTGYNYMNAF